MRMNLHKRYFIIAYFSRIDSLFVLVLLLVILNGNTNNLKKQKQKNNKNKTEKTKMQTQKKKSSSSLSSSLSSFVRTINAYHWHVTVKSLKFSMMPKSVDGNATVIDHRQSVTNGHSKSCLLNC